MTTLLIISLVLIGIYVMHTNVNEYVNRIATLRERSESEIGLDSLD